ncbi:MAG: hypothetical protein MAGBODY4_00200 [Candidatus Marinimicrobia bacterium]|nr:hypothetical protein [Candidatus Neomarinimicrobiota bacterium]
MRNSIVGIVLLLLPLVVHTEPKPTPEQVFFLPWGNGIEYREAPGGRFGPRSFLVDSGKVYLLNTNRNRVDLIDQDEVSKVVDVPPYSDDFTMIDNQVYVLHDNQIVRIKNDEQSTVFHPAESQQVISGLSAADSNVIVRLANGESRIVRGQGTVRKVSGQYFSEEKILTVRKTDNHAVELVSVTPDGAEQKTSLDFGCRSDDPELR